MSFKIIVDSCCDLTPAQLREDCFVSVPLTIRVGEHIVVDDASFDQGALLWRMKESATAPQSSCPSPIQYLEAFDCGADDLYVVTLSALLSGSHNAAAQARSLWLEDHPNSNVHIFNSCSASAGEVLVALKIQELAQSGMDFTTVVSQVSRYINEMETYFVLETAGSPGCSPWLPAPCTSSCSWAPPPRVRSAKRARPCLSSRPCPRWCP